jgi:hypothetical protein
LSADRVRLAAGHGVLTVVLGASLLVKQIGLGLAVAVLIDSTKRATTSALSRYLAR